VSLLATGAIDIAEAAYDLEVGAADWLARVLEAGRQTIDAVAGGVNVLSEDQERRPAVYEAIRRNVGCEDFLSLWALDPDFHGVNIPIPSPKTIQLSKRARDHWKMLVIHIGDPRGLTEREAQVVTYAALGESGKIIGYRFGLSTSTVSSLLLSAMHKLGVSSQAQLAEKMRGFPPASAVSTPD
jgi:DNA-binding CsgD family transcriptional regulator